jgi:hypothetical protein
MFDRAGMKLGLDKAVMGTHNEDGQKNKSNELNRKEIEDLLKKGAYGAMLDDEASSKFCEEDIDQILERRTKVIRHEGNEKGSVFSKATFSAGLDEDMEGVDLDDPDFWEKWAAKAQIDTSEIVNEKNALIVSEPRRRRQVQKFGSKLADEDYSSNDNAGDSDAYEDDEEELEKPNSRNKRDQQVRPWSLSEKTKYERKLMIYGYGSWELMASHFPRRTEKDLKAVTRTLMRKVLPTIDKNTEEDRKLVQDINNILQSDAREEGRKVDTVPFSGATKKQIAEFKSFLADANKDYSEHVERKGRNFLLRIQLLDLIRDKIVPKKWEQAKQLVIPNVTGSPPVPWWTEDEDRSLLLGICKHGYQQYLAIRNDPEFTFFGKKFDDSQSGGLEDDDDAPAPATKKAPAKRGRRGRQPAAPPKPEKDEEDSEYEDNNNNKDQDDEEEEEEEEEDEEEGSDAESSKAKKGVYMWPSKADIGMRLRRIIAAFLRERANDLRKQKLIAKVQKKENDRRSRQQRGKGQRTRTTRSQGTDAGANRWSKKNRSDFLKTLLSFGVERIVDDDDEEFQWTRFKEIAGLEKKTDESLTLYYDKILAACEESVKRHQTEQGNSANNDETPVSSPRPKEDNISASRESSAEPAAAAAKDDTAAKDDDNSNGEVVPYDRARRALKRIEQMKLIREKVLVDLKLDEFLRASRRTSGLPR